MFEELFSLTNLFYAWKKFKKGKSRKKDVIEFEYHLENNIFSLHADIISGNYRHGAYVYFQVFDSKKRDIYKACVRDRIVHQVIYDYLNTIYESKFINDSYSSRIDKGNIRAIQILKYFSKLCSGSKYKNCYILKCDIKKYFQNIDHQILLTELNSKVMCTKTFAIIKNIVHSFLLDKNIKKGIPLGNITSQIFANIYLHKLQCRYYIRYNDDFVIVGLDKTKLEEIKKEIIIYVSQELYLEIPYNKTSIRKVTWGVDFLGYIILNNGILLRNKTKYKVFKNINPKNFTSYFGLLRWCNSYTLKQKIIALYTQEKYYFIDTEFKI